MNTSQNIPKTNTLIRFTGFYSVKPGPPFFDLQVFTESSQAPFFDLQDFYKVKSGPLFRFTRFLQSQVRPPFSIYRVFTGSSEYCFSAIVNTFLHVIYTILQEIFTGSLQKRCCKYMLYILQYIYMFLN